MVASRTCRLGASYAPGPGIEPATFQLRDDVQPTEPHQPEQLQSCLQHDKPRQNHTCTLSQWDKVLWEQRGENDELLEPTRGAFLQKA